ncbi:cell division protein FtsK [Aphanothece hegewaldii CCALA 016]|uniref:Cell division protein FtsK n=1 Tax=Aphanothece hegewaldii CCALA 016 TaxID=2107694 RepID=A0A2T1LTD4_9CHRO|nr:FtsK/SpoIIIE domain-containing protein [Aphanothece hegewaldii]PSF33911.1 cell division protein FtsK [Aphanothece hegewaldii CCALA 016]
MFSKKHKPLPNPVFQVAESSSTTEALLEQTGILLGDNCYWNPVALPNGHIVVIGASGSGKTQTLKAIAYSMRQTYPDIQVFCVDFHGDQEIIGETCYPLHMASPHGINPLVINLDPEGGGPNLQAIAVTQTLKRSLQLGPNQEGLMLEILETCYNLRGITQEQPTSWTKKTPNFSDIQKVIEGRIENGCKESVKLKLKMAASFQYGVFSRPQPEFKEKHIRIDLSKLPPEIGAIAAESLAWQLMNQHRLGGERSEKLPCTYLVIDEAKELKKSRACDRIIADGRKYGLGLILASQSERHLSADVIGNSSTKIVLPVDSSEVKKVAAKFRLAENKLAQLKELSALCRFGKDAEQVNILPYYQRIEQHG